MRPRAWVSVSFEWVGFDVDSVGETPPTLFDSDTRGRR